MIEAGGGLGFTAETSQRFAGIGVITQDPLHGDDPAGMALASAVDYAHPAPADFLKDFVVPEAPVLVRQIDFRERANERVGFARVVRIEPALEQAADAKSARDVRRRIATRTRGRICEHARD